MKKDASIIVVDDEQVVLSLVQRILEESGYTVVTASNGQEALDKISQFEADLLLLDIMMPGLNGFEVLSLLRKQYDIPVIMLTGQGEVTNVRDALNLGADDYITKPFKPRELVARIEAKLRRSKLKRADTFS